MLWLRGRRPKEPSRWPRLVRPLEARVAAWARGKLKLAQDEILFEDVWVRLKVAFSRRQRLKCGYCELPLAADAKGGTIDHHRPKAEITRLHDDPATWGEEVRGHNSRDPQKPRQAHPVCRPGYWWLAYAVGNYVLSCSVCNEKWKGNLFPIEGGHRRPPTRKSCARERPLLLDPYGEVDPASHLEFDEIGLVVARGDSPIGLETIRTYHLGRRSLREAREPIAKEASVRIKGVLRELSRAPMDEPRLRRALTALLRWGSAHGSHAGMVRILWAQRDPYALSWNDLRALRASLAR